MTIEEALRSNGQLSSVELPAAREAVIEQAQRIHQEVAHERDVLQRKLYDAEASIAGYKVATEAQASQLASMESRMQEAILKRDQEVARRAAVEAALSSMLAIGRAFQIKSEPMIRTLDQENQQ
jgi:hypothetical protein